MQKSIILILGIFFCCVCRPSFAQKKIKYDKDIFPLIEAKNYEEAMPLIWEYLANPKTAEEPNANLQVGLYYEELVNNYDLIADSTAVLGASDTAVVYLTKAKTLITEKEIKKNDEFYQAFHRRDLRTGDFGIKISDVQLDIEKKLQSLKNVNKFSKEAYADLFAINAAVEYSQSAYTAFVNQYKSINDLYLMATEGVMDTLVVLMDKSAEIKSRFSAVRDAVSRIGKKGYSPELNFKPVSTYGEDGLSKVNVFANDVLAWDYGKWAGLVEEMIKGDISKLKDKIVSTNSDLKTQSDQIKSGAGITAEDLTTALDEALVVEISQYDQDPMALRLLNILVNKNKYDFITNASLNEQIADPDDVDYQLSVTDSLLQLVDLLDQDVATLVEPAITIGAKKYGQLINESYGGDIGLIKYRKSLETTLAAARSKWMTNGEQYKIRARWGVSEDGTDSLYLIPRMDTTYVAHDFSKYYSIVSMKDDSSNTYVVGLEFKGASDMGFIARVNNARKILWKNNFKLTSFTYSDTEFLVSGQFIPAPEGNVAVYIFSSVPESKNNIIALSVKPEGETNWVNHRKISRAPVDVKFNEIVKETIFYTKTEQELEEGTGDPDDPGYFVVDRSGNVR